MSDTRSASGGRSSLEREFRKAQSSLWKRALWAMVTFRKVPVSFHEELSVLGARTSALHLLALRREKPEVARGFAEVSDDVLLFEVTAWYLAIAGRLLRSSGIPEAYRSALLQQYQQEVAQFAAAFASQCGFKDVPVLLRLRGEQYPDAMRPGIRLFCNALMRSRASHSPTLEPLTPEVDRAAFNGFEMDLLAGALFEKEMLPKLRELTRKSVQGAWAG